MDEATLTGHAEIGGPFVRSIAYSQVPAVRFEVPGNVNQASSVMALNFMPGTVCVRNWRVNAAKHALSCALTDHKQATNIELVEFAADFLMLR